MLHITKQIHRQSSFYEGAYSLISPPGRPLHAVGSDTRPSQRPSLLRLIAATSLSTPAALSCALVSATAAALSGCPRLRSCSVFSLCACCDRACSIKDVKLCNGSLTRKSHQTAQCSKRQVARPFLFQACQWSCLGKACLLPGLPWA